MNKTKRFLSTLIAGALLASIGFSAIMIDAVRVENLEKEVLNDSFIKAHTSLRVGRELETEAELNAAVAQDIDSLRRSERFSYADVLVEQDAGKRTLVYRVTPRLRLRKIDLIGFEKVKSKKIKTELGLNPGDYVDQALVAEKARSVQAWLREKSYSDAIVSSELIADGTTGDADLLLTIHEGSKLRVKKIRFGGERFLSDSRTERTKRFLKRVTPGVGRSQEPVEFFETRELRKVMNQKEAWGRWFGAYHPEKIDADRAALRAFYLNRGFLDVQVDEPEVLDLGGGALELFYRIHEGQSYRFGTLSFDGATLFEPAELQKQIRLGSGQVASRRAIDTAAASVTRHYGNRGHIHSYVEPVIQTDPATRTADVLFQVKEGPLATLNEIEIRGNEKTRDEVIRRELAVYPGELFHQEKVEISERRLKNLGYFESVTPTYVPATETNAYDLTFNVKEKAMGSFLVGAGVGSVQGLVGFAEISHGNFDMTQWPPIGDGQKVKVRAEVGTDGNDLEVSFVEPWFLDRKLALGVDLYHRSVGYYSSQYDLETLGGRVSLSKPLAPFVRGTLTYSLENFDVSGVSSSAATEIQAEAGVRSKSSVGFTVSRDTRDQVFFPTRGNRTSATAELSGGPLLGDTEIYLFKVRSTHFWPFFNDHVLSVKGEVRVVDSYGSGDVPIFDRLFLGGPNSIRGFAYRDVSPRSADAGSDEPIGGNSSYYGTIEYTVPLWDKIRGAAFYDIGAVNDSSFNFGTGGLNSSYGLGARFDLPMFPLRLDYALPHITDSANEGASPRWNFSLGYTF